MRRLNVRIDDRLIHGQVVVGWCPLLKPDRIVLCDDEIAKSEWERQVFREAACEYQVIICNVQETVGLLRDSQSKNEKVFLIVESPVSIVALVQGGADIDEVVVGGMHYEAGKTRIADYIYVSEQDREHFRFLRGKNVRLIGQNVPSSKPLQLSTLLKIK